LKTIEFDRPSHSRRKLRVSFDSSFTIVSDAPAQREGHGDFNGRQKARFQTDALLTETVPTEF
jgi:hypothetical protein